MKATFNVHGHLTVKAENATETFALRTWTQNWGANTSPLIVVVESMGREPGCRDFIETDVRQLFRSSNFADDTQADQKIARLDALLCAAFKRRSTVEQALYDMASGKVPMPDAAKLRALALHLGVPDSEVPA